MCYHRSRAGVILDSQIQQKGRRRCVLLAYTSPWLAARACFNICEFAFNAFITPVIPTSRHLGSASDALYTGICWNTGVSPVRLKNIFQRKFRQLLRSDSAPVGSRTQDTYSRGLCCEAVRVLKTRGNQQQLWHGAKSREQFWDEWH